MNKGRSEVRAGEKGVLPALSAPLSLVEVRVHV